MATGDLIPSAQLIGYFAKPTAVRPPWLKAPQVTEICSVADCISRLECDWISEWRHNELGFYDTPELAWSVVPEPLRAGCDLYAYAMLPVRFVGGVQEAFTIPGVNPVRRDGSFVRLGYDMVSREFEAGSGHSPLSCNGLAEEVPTNRHCLIATAAEAVAVGLTMEIPGQRLRGEPGPYHIVEVWRRPARLS